MRVCTTRILVHFCHNFLCTGPLASSSCSLRSFVKTGTSLKISFWFASCSLQKIYLPTTFRNIVRANQKQSIGGTFPKTFSFELRFWHNFVPDIHDSSDFQGPPNPGVPHCKCTAGGLAHTVRKTTPDRCDSSFRNIPRPPLPIFDARDASSVRCAPAVRALVMRVRAVRLRVVCGVLVQRSPTSWGAR